VYPGLVDEHAFFTVAGTKASVLGYATAHGPRGARQGDSGSSSRGEAWRSFDFGSVAGVLALRELVVSVIQIGPGEVAIRVDSQVAPLPVLPGEGRGPGRVRVVESGTTLGQFGFTLRCDPAGGTMPQPARICAAIARDSTLLYSFPGPDHSCPFGAPAVSLVGSWDGKPLRSSFSECVGGQEAQAGKWASLLPSISSLATIALDRRIGLVRLGEREAAALDLLRGRSPTPRSCPNCTRHFRGGFSIGYGAHGSEPASWTVAFSHGLVSLIAGNFGFTIGSAVVSQGYTSLRSSLAARGWTATRCGSERWLEHRSDRGSTLIIYGPHAYRETFVSATPFACATTDR
jgi:hypothetical protein